MRYIAIIAGLAVSCVAFSLGAAQEPTAGTFKATGNTDYDDAVMRFIKGDAPKIVGGVPATPGAYPWQVSLVVSNISDAGRAHFCGGSIHSARWIITAAHCMAGLTSSQFQAIVGTHTLSKSSDRQSVKRRIIHGDYQKTARHDSDIALIELEQALDLSGSAKPVTVLSTADESGILVEDRELIVTGWGATVQGGGVVRDLRQVRIPFTTRQTCSDPLSYGNLITDTMICAGLAAGGMDSCQGDSGGPLVSTTSPALLVGIVSWGEGCARPAKYGVYTRIANFKSWIDACTRVAPVQS
jgi:secreted trypsin-like serine protease